MHSSVWQQRRHTLMAARFLVAAALLAAVADARRQLTEAAGGYGGYGNYGSYGSYGSYGGYGYYGGDITSGAAHHLGTAGRSADSGIAVGGDSSSSSSTSAPAHLPDIPGTRGACGFPMHCGMTYQTRVNDTCSSIEALFGISHDLFVNQNSRIWGGPHPFSCIRPFDPDLLVCVGVEHIPCSKTYTVTADDTCDTLLYNTGIYSEPSIQDLNPHFVCDRPVPGDVLCVEEDENTPYQRPEGCGLSPEMQEPGKCQFIIYVDTGIGCRQFKGKFANNDVESFKELNPGVTCNNAMIGQDMCVPPSD